MPLVWKYFEADEGSPISRRGNCSTIGLGVSRFGLSACHGIAIFASDPLIADLGGYMP